MTAPLLEMKEIEKSFFGVPVLKKVPFELHAGEVHALVGENGAGKSTLIKILNGDYDMDAGQIVLAGEPVTIAEPRDAEELGIRMVYQELHYAPDLSVAENLLLGHLPRRGNGLGRFLVDWREARRIAREYLDRLGVSIDPDATLGNLSVVEREIVEIVKALSRQARVIVLDEPTAALTPREVQHLFRIIRSLRDQGVGIIYISHRLDEVFEIADRVTVLRDGEYVGTRDVDDVTQRELVQMMVGRDIGERWVRAKPLDAADREGQPSLEVRGLSKKGVFHDVSLALYPGEIVGIFGLVGAGHATLTRAIFGAESVDAGEILVDGKPAPIKTPRHARRHGLGLVPIDRKVQALVMERSVKENVTLSNWNDLARNGFFRRRLEKQHAHQWIDQLGIRMAGDMETKIAFLSGGNQQKCVLARWLEAGVDVLLLNEPTWGVDVGARFDIYEQLEALADQGLSILMVSSDIQEVLAVSHRVLTMYKGHITAEFSQDVVTQEKLLHAAAGGVESD
ncbi:MAG: sugar ABC transporter ATP-binding protein [bacterium]